MRLAIVKWLYGCDSFVLLTKIEGAWRVHASLAGLDADSLRVAQELAAQIAAHKNGGQDVCPS